MTNKCHTIDDLHKKLKFFGFRGEALANIIKISKSVTITSKERDVEYTYCKKIEKEESRIDRVQNRLSCGTTVAIEGFLSNLPVRQQCIKKSEIHTLKRNLESLTIIHPQVSFSLRNDANGKMILNCQKSSNVKTAFCNIHPSIDATNFAFFKVKKSRITVKALIYKTTYENKRLQYVYVNKRPICAPEILCFVNSSFKLSKPAKTNQKWPILIIHIKCPCSDVDLNLTSDKTPVFFKKFDCIKFCLKKLLDAYFGTDNLEKIDKKSCQQQVLVGPSQIHGAVKELKIKRKIDNVLGDDSSHGKLIKFNNIIGKENIVPSVSPPKSSEKSFILSKNEERNVLPLKTQKIDVTCNTLFTEFPENENKGKHVIMDMFLKSMTVYPSQCNPPTQNIKDVISVGVQTSPFLISSNNFQFLEEKKPIRDNGVTNPKPHNAIFDSNVDLFSMPVKQQIDHFSQKTKCDNLKNMPFFQTESPYFNKKKLKTHSSKNDLDVSTVSKYFFQKPLSKADAGLSAGNFFLEVDQTEDINKKLDLSEDLFSQPKFSPLKLNNGKKPRSQDFSFCLMERLDCVPKGLSPLLKQVDVDEMSLEGKENLQKAVIEEFDDELLLIKWQNYVYHKDPKKFFEGIYLEKSKALHGIVPSVSKKHTECVSFSKNLFKNLEVIGQVDKKFIVAFDTLKDLVLLFDQHAVHERVRLEELMNGYQNMSKPVEKKFAIFLPHSSIDLLKEYQDQVTKLGIKLSFFANGINVHEVPLSIYNKSKRGGNIVDLVKVLINEVIGILTDNKGVIMFTPNTILNIIKSEACRGAIKFGDFLERDECFAHLSALSNCDLPFQCAHGRPTLTPLMFLNNMPDLTVPKPNLQKLQYLNCSK